MFSHLSLFTIALYGVGFILDVVALLVVPRDRKPAAGMAWLLIIFLLPYLGWPLFLILGTNKLPRNRQSAQKLLDRIIDKRVFDAGEDISDDIPEKYRSFARLTTALGHLPPLYGTAADYLTDYNQTLKRITKDLKKAKTNIYLEYFILAFDKDTEPIFEALKNAVERGVEVRVLFDWWGSFRYKGYRAMKQYMTKHDIPFHSMLPFTFSFKNYQRFDLRNHRKLIVVDDAVGYLGSQNIITRSYRRRDGILYDELVVRVKGLILDELKAIFAYDWAVESDRPLHHILTDDVNEKGLFTNRSILQILPSGPSYNDENNLKTFAFAINRAEHEIFIANPYFVPSEPLLSAITTAAKRGVRVRMLNSEAIDQVLVGYAQRSYYAELMKAGVELYLYNKPILLHSKFMMIDNELAIVGSSNLDIRSFELDQELSLILYSKKDVMSLGHVRDEYLSNSHRIHIEEWQRRKAGARFLDNIARLTSNIQ